MREAADPPPRGRRHPILRAVLLRNRSLRERAGLAAGGWTVAAGADCWGGVWSIDRSAAGYARRL